MNRRLSFLSFLLVAMLMLSASFAQAAGPSAEDRQLTKDVYAALKDGFKPDLAHSPQLVVKTFKGAVVLEGAADDENTAKMAAGIASRVKGVKTVQNLITVPSSAD